MGRSFPTTRPLRRLIDLRHSVVVLLVGSIPLVIIWRYADVTSWVLICSLCALVPVDLQ